MAYKSKRKPRVKQAEALRVSRGKKVFAFRMAQRTGKTKVTIDRWGELVAECKSQDLFIVAPAGCYDTWVPAVELDLPDAMFQRTKIHLWESGSYSSKKRQALLADFLKPQDGVLRVFIMNVEAISMVMEARSVARQFLEGRDGAYFAIDESTCIKNYQAACTKFINAQLRDLAYYRSILSGLMSPKSPLDIYTQFEFLDPRILKYDNFFSFRHRYAVMQTHDFGGRKVELVVGHRDTKELYKKIDPWSFRVRLEDCYDMPPATYAIRNVKLTDQQERMYRELKEYATTLIEADKFVTATAVITQILRIHQMLCGHTVDDENGEEHEIKENRVAAVLEELSEYEGKAIIWCCYDLDIRKVSAALEKEFGDPNIKFDEGKIPKGRVARFWGGNRKTRLEEEKRFKEDPECLYMVATPDAGKFGRTWDIADSVIYYASRNNLEHRLQSEERPKAVGKTKPISYVDLKAVRKDGSKTVEDKIIHALRNKLDMAATINGDNWREWLV